jgi:hypothetical protein
VTGLRQDDDLGPPRWCARVSGVGWKVAGAEVGRPPDPGRSVSTARCAATVSDVRLRLASTRPVLLLTREGSRWTSERTGSWFGLSGSADYIAHLRVRLVDLERDITCGPIHGVSARQNAGSGTGIHDGRVEDANSRERARATRLQALMSIGCHGNKNNASVFASHASTRAPDRSG